MPQPTSGIWTVTRATTPEVADMGIEPVASGVGRYDGAAWSGRLLDEIIPLRRDAAGEIGHLEDRTCGAGVLDAPTGDVYRSVSEVMELDVVILDDCVVVAATAVHPANHDVARKRLSRRGDTQQRKHEHQAEWR